jgi:hypothetical protein
MQVITTKVPMAVEDLKKHFTDDDVFYLIDQKNSDLDKAKVLTYLSNLDIEADIQELDNDFLKAYLHSTNIVDLPSVEGAVIDILLDCKCEHGGTGKYTQFINDNKDILQKWIDRLDSLILFNAYIVKHEEMQQYAQSFPHDETNDAEGINFVSILRHERFFSYYSSVNTDRMKFYTKYFNDYMFKGKNLFEYWANKNNPMFLLTWGIAEGHGPDMIEAKKRDEELAKNVTYF